MLETIGGVTWACSSPTFLGLFAGQRSMRHLKICCFRKRNIEILLFQLPLSCSGNSFFFWSLINSGIYNVAAKLKRPLSKCSSE